MATVTPRSLRGVAHALLSQSRVAAAAKRFPDRIRVGFAQEVASPRSAESCPDPCPDRPADRHRSISVTRTQEAASSALQAPHSTGVRCCRNRPSRTRLWSDTHARQASALPRRPVRAADLTRVRLAPLWPLRDGRHHTDCRRAQFDTHLGLAVSDDHAGDSGETGAAAMKRSTNRRTSGSVCAERPGHSRSSGGVHVRNMVALLIQAKRQTSDLTSLRSCETA